MHVHQQSPPLLRQLGIGHLPPQQCLQRTPNNDSPPSHQHQLLPPHQCLSIRWHPHNRPKQHFSPLSSVLSSPHLYPFCIKPSQRDRRTRQRRRCKPARFTTISPPPSDKLFKTARRRPTLSHRKTMVHKPLRPRNVLSGKPSSLGRFIKLLDRNLQHWISVYFNHSQHHSPRHRQRHR